MNAGDDLSDLQGLLITAVADVRPRDQLARRSLSAHRRRRLKTATLTSAAAVSAIALTGAVSTAVNQSLTPDQLSTTASPGPEPSSTCRLSTISRVPDCPVRPTAVPEAVGEPGYLPFPLTLLRTSNEPVPTGTRDRVNALSRGYGSDPDLPDTELGGIGVTVLYGDVTDDVLRFFRLPTGHDGGVRIDLRPGDTVLRSERGNNLTYFWRSGSRTVIFVTAQLPLSVSTEELERVVTSVRD